MTAEPRAAAPCAPGVPQERPALWEDRHQPGRMGVLFAAIWLVYLIDPIKRASTSSTAPIGWRVAAVAALLLFCAGFVAFFGWWRVHRVAGRTPAARQVWPVVAAGAALIAVAAPGAGESALGGLIYVGVTAVMTLPLRRSLLVVAACAALMTFLPRLVPGWSPTDDATAGLLLGCFAAFGVSQVIERNAQLARARAQLVDLTVTWERERMGRDVHDILGHSLTVITVKTELAGRLLEAVPPTPARDRALAEVADVERLAREALADVRATVSGTREISLTGELAAARQALTAAGIAADLPGAVDVVPPRFRTLFAWALREGVTNVVRHSGAGRCVVRFSADCLEVRDDGRGPESRGDGTGLVGLRTRAEAAGARLEIGRAPGGGFLLRVVAGGGAA